MSQAVIIDAVRTPIGRASADKGYYRYVRADDLSAHVIEALVKRVVHLGFEVRVELELKDGEAARAQLTRAQTDELELGEGDIVYVRPPVHAAVAGNPGEAAVASEETALSA